MPETNGIKPVSVLPESTESSLTTPSFLWQSNIFEPVEYSPSGWTIPPYYSAAGDLWLRNFYKSNEHVPSVVGNVVNLIKAVPARIETYDPDNQLMLALAELQTNLFVNSWEDEGTQGIIDFLTIDNGMFFEVLGSNPEDDPEGALEPTLIEGGLYIPATGLRHLDSCLCQRTGDPNHPVIFHYKGDRFRLHETRVLYFSDLPSPDADLLGVGFASLRRTINAAMSLAGSQQWDKERKGAGGLFNQLVVAAHIDHKALTQNFTHARMRAEDMSHKHYMQIPIITAEHAPPGTKASDLITSIPLTNLPPDWDIMRDYELWFKVYASALGIDPGELWRGNTVGETKAEAEIQRTIGRKFERSFFNQLGKQLNRLFCSQDNYVVFDYEDDIQDRERAEIFKLEQEGYTLALANGTMTKQVAWQQMLESGRITDDQFQELNAQPDEPQPMIEEAKALLKTHRAKKKALADDYQFEVNRLVEQAVAGEISKAEFEVAMLDLIEQYGTDAFYEGAGLEETDPLTNEEQEQLDLKLAAIIAAMLAFSLAIYEGEYEGREAVAMQRASLWGSSIRELEQFGILFGGDDDALFRWEIDPVKDHCRDCLFFDGQVKTRGEWREIAITTGKYPKSYALECSGRHCGCGYVSVN